MTFLLHGFFPAHYFRASETGLMRICDPLPPFRVGTLNINTRSDKQQFSGSISVKIMAKIFRRAANKVKNCRDGHGSLGLLVFDEKVVCETFQKVVIAKADGEFLSYTEVIHH